MPVADLKDEILRLAQQPVGPEPLMPPTDRPKLGEPTDTDALKTEILRMAAAPEPRGAVRRFAAGAGQALLGMPGQVAEGVGIATGSEGLAQFGQSIQPTPDGVLPYVQPGEEGVAANAGQAIGSGLAFAPMAALGGIPGALLVSGSAAAQAIPDAFYGAKAGGADDDTAWKAALVSGIGQGALETVLGPERLIGKIAGAMAKADRATGGLGRELLTSAAGEGVEEASQSLWADMVAQDLYKVEPDEDWATRLSKASEQAAYGALGGGVLGSVALAAERYARDEGLPTERPEPPKPPEPDRSPPVYDPVERDLTPEETSALDQWKEARGATTANVVERPEAEDAVRLARKTGASVLFVEDDGKGAKEAARYADGNVIVLPANADPAGAMLAVATHEAIHALPLSQRDALIQALGTPLSLKGPGGKTIKRDALTKAHRAAYADRADAEGLKYSKRDLDEEGVADLAAGLAPVMQRLMQRKASAVSLMHEKPALAVRLLRAVRSAFGKSSHAKEMATELDTLAEVSDQLAKGLTGPQRVQAAQRIVDSFEAMKVEMSRPVRVKASEVQGPPEMQGPREMIGPANPYEGNTERGLTAVADSDRTPRPGVARDAGRARIEERARGMNAEVARQNETYRPSPITLGESQRFEGVSDEDLKARRDAAAESQAYESDLALREAGFSDSARAKYVEARGRAVEAQRKLDMAKNDADAREARGELQDAARRVQSFESRLTDAQRARLRSGEDPEVYDRVIAAREARAKGRFGAGRALDRAVPSTRYSLASDAGAQGDDVEAARKAWKEQGTDSPWFRRWFAGSKVVDGEGKPLVVYHGTNRDFTTFSEAPSKTGNVTAGLGHYFSADPDEASRYTRDFGDREGGRVLPVYLSIQNPYEMTYREWNEIAMRPFNASVSDARGMSAAMDPERMAKIRQAEDDARQYVADLKARLIAEGYDGIQVHNGKMREYVAFDSAQIKSATGNRGTFSPANPDIRYSLKSDIESVISDVSEPEGYQHAVASEELPARLVAKYVAQMNPTQRKGVEEMMADADAILADRSAREKLVRRALNQEPLNEAEQIALDRIASLKATNAWRQGASMDNAVEARAAFRMARSASGRILGNPALRDALQSPAERAMALALTPSKQVARALKKAKTWQARRAIIEEEARKIERIRYSLAQKGFDPALIPDDYFKDPTFRNVWAESVADAKANGKWDWYIQWRRAAMLSGPITTIRNVTGNTSYVTYDRIARIWADAVIPGTGTSVEDARAYTRDIFAGIAQGWKDARTAYSAFYDASTEGTSLDEHATFRRGPIMVGLEAVGVRAQAAQDIFFRSVVGAAETRLRARQKARAEGGTAEDYMSDPDVLAMSKEDMERALFLDRDALTRSITGARDWLDEKARFPVGTTIVPFAATPTKIVQRGGETLLGPLGGYMRDREKWGGALLGAGAWAAMIWAASMFDDDDGLPLITGSRARGGQGDFQDRTAPAYSIRIGDEYYSYQTIEPLSTALAAIADAVQSEDPMKSVSSFAAAAKDKSFFRSIETVYDAIVGAANGERGSDRAKQVARDLLWTPMIPNIVRSPVRAADETRRKELGNPLEAEDFLNAAVPTGDFGPPLRYDLWGRPAEKAGGSWVSRVLAPAMGTKDVEDVEKIDLLLADYNRKSDEDKFFSAPQVYVERNNIRRDWTEEEYSELTRDAGAQALTILRPWAANKTELTERDLKHISDVLSKTRARKVEELLRR